MSKHLAAWGLLCLFSLLGCNPEFEDSKGGGNDPGPSSIQSKRLEKYVRVRVQPSAAAEKYMVYFSWPQIEDGKLIRIRLDRTLAVINPNQTDFNHEVNHDQVLTYTFETLNNASQVENSFPKQIKVPRDFVVREGQSEFLEDTRLSVNRIFFGPNFPLKTNGHKVEIIANQLRAEGGVLETFPEGAKAPIDTDGKTAGDLILRADSASGALKIYMRGESGGDGSKGAAYPDPALGGEPAGKGVLDCTCSGPHCDRFSNFIEAVEANWHPQEYRCRCISYGKNGGIGKTGAKGKMGLPAHNGGSTGTLKVAIQDGREFDLQTYAVRGQPGTPGEGGDGQRGGLGGVGRTQYSYGDCRGWAGPRGNNGPKGDSGEPGRVGDLGLMCICIASERKNDCYQ